MLHSARGGLHYHSFFAVFFQPASQPATAQRRRRSDGTTKTTQRRHNGDDDGGDDDAATHNEDDAATAQRRRQKGKHGSHVTPSFPLCWPASLQVSLPASREPTDGSHVTPGVGWATSYRGWATSYRALHKLQRALYRTQTAYTKWLAQGPVLINIVTTALWPKKTSN